jgi:uncharacterized protein (DUF1499 family)
MLGRIITGVSLAAIAAALAVFVAGPGARLGLWNVMTGLGILLGASIPVVVLSLLSLIALVIAFLKKRSLAPLAAAAFVLSTGASMIPALMISAASKVPSIHDISTDISNPPRILAGALAERANPADYVGRDPAPGSTPPMLIAEAQALAYPDIVPLEVAGSTEEVASRARSVVESMGMEVLAEGDEPGIHTIEAVATSFWFGFRDDFVVRIAGAGEGRSRIDIRSKSRVGQSDLGANAARIRAFSAAYAKVEGGA